MHIRLYCIYRSRFWNSNSLLKYRLNYIEYLYVNVIVRLSYRLATGQCEWRMTHALRQSSYRRQACGWMAYAIYSKIILSIERGRKKCSVLILNSQLHWAHEIIKYHFFLLQCTRMERVIQVFNCAWTIQISTLWVYR